jgi:hypothetical protein
VTSSDENSVCTPAAYLLVYFRKDLHEKYLNNREPVSEFNRSGANNSQSSGGNENMDY